MPAISCALVNSPAWPAPTCDVLLYYVLLATLIRETQHGS
jgi:hypothetical protein